MLVQYFITEDEEPKNTIKTESIRHRIHTLNLNFRDRAPWIGHSYLFSELNEWIGVHKNPSADDEKHRQWVNLPSQELVAYLNRLWDLSNKISVSGSILPVVKSEILDILDKMESRQSF